MPVINTNVSSLIAQNAISSNSRAQSSAMQQLSTGLRISGAKDDAAGLAIASKMTSQIKGLDQAVRNANDAISMLQTADGALVAVGDMMQRMRELAVQGASDTNVASDRTALNAEFSQLKTEITRITKNTQWNGMNILDGSNNGGTFNFQIGASSGQSFNTTIANAGFSTAGTTATSVVSGVGSAEVSTVTLAGTSTFKENDTITINANGAQFQYTITAAKAATYTTAESVAGAGIKLLADDVYAGFAAASQTFNGLTLAHTASTAVITLTGNAANPNGFTATSSTSGGSLATLSALDVTSQGTASAAILGLDNAIAATNTQRSGLGATINRLTYAADNLANVSQNAQASRSRIQDTDYAKTSTELARTQIIAQAATAMLAQANQSQQSVLALLK